MPSLWDKIRGSRRKVKIRSKSVNDSQDEDEFLQAIRKRESFIETTQTDWVDVPMPKTQSLGRGMKLEPEKKAKSATLDVGFSFKRKNEWKPKVKDIEEVKVKTKKDKNEDKKKETKFDKKKDKRKSREVDFENAQLERGESFMVKRRMVIWRADKRLSHISMDPISTVEQWAACSRDATSPGSMTPGSPGSLVTPTTGTPGSVPTPGGLSAGTVDSTAAGSGTFDSATAAPPASPCFQIQGPSRPLSFQPRNGLKLDIRTEAAAQSNPELRSPSQIPRRVSPEGKGSPLQSPRSPEVALGPVLRPPGSVNQAQKKRASRSHSKDSLQSPTFESRPGKPSSGPGTPEGARPSRIPKLMKRGNKPHGASPVTTPTSPVAPPTNAVTPTSPSLVEGPVLTPPPRKERPRSQGGAPMTTGSTSPISEGPLLTPPVKQGPLLTPPASKGPGLTPPPLTGPVLTPPFKSMAQPSQDTVLKPSQDQPTTSVTLTSVLVSNSAEQFTQHEVSTESTIKCDAAMKNNNIPDTVMKNDVITVTMDTEVAENPDVSGKVDLHNSLSRPGDDGIEMESRCKSAKLALTELLERTAPPAKSTDDLTDIDECSEPRLDRSTDELELDDRTENYTSSTLVDSSGNRTLVDDSRHSVEMKVGSLVTSDSMEFIEADEAPNAEAVTGYNGYTETTCSPRGQSRDSSEPRDMKNMTTSIDTDVIGSENSDSKLSKNSSFSDNLKVETSMNGHCDISPSGAGDTLATTNGTDEFYITSTKYYDDEENLADHGIFEMDLHDIAELNESKDSVELDEDFRLGKKDEPVEIQIQIPESKAIPPKHLNRERLSLSSPSSPSRPVKPICLVAYPRRLVNLSPCERCSRSIDSILSGLDDLESPILEQDVHDWVLVDKDFESPKLPKRKLLDKKVQTDFQNPIDIKKARVCSSNSSSLPEMRASVDRNSSTLEDFDSMVYDDYVVPSQLLKVSDAHYRISGQCSSFDEFELFGQISPLGQCPSPLEEEPKKSSAAKPVSQVKGHQPDLVSNSIGSRAHAAQEISRLEALCEARTKELTFAKMQIKSASQGFDAMSVIVQYLSDDMNAFQSPELKKRLITAEKKITSLLLDLDDLRCEKSRIESLMHDLIQSHKEAVEAMRADHRAQIGAAEERVSKKQHDDLQKVIDQHTEEVKTLKSYHEKRFKELEDRSERLGEETRRKHARQLKDLAESDERHLSELQKQHEIKLEDITKRFEEIKCTLHDKVYSLKAECDELRNRSQMYEQALQQDTDFQVQKPESEESEAVKSIKIPKGPPGTPLRGALGSPLRGSPLRGSPMRGDERRPLSWSFHGDSASAAYLECVESLKQFDKELALAPYRDLPQEIDSLRAVLEMRNAEIHELRQSKAELEKQLTELPSAREKIISLEQKIENLEAIVSMKQDYEKQLVEKHQMLLRRYDKESKANKRLSMDNEELMYRLNETEDLLLSPSPDGGPPGGLPRQTSLDLDPQILNQKRTGVSPVTTPDILARRGFCRSPHDGAAVMRRVRTSSTSSSDDKRSSTISMRSETGENS